MHSAEGTKLTQTSDICIYSVVLTLSSLFGFLLGCVTAGTGAYTYLAQEYKTSNDMLTEDIYVCLYLTRVHACAASICTDFER